MSEFDKSVQLLANMCVDRMMGGLDQRTFLSNLQMILDKLEQEADKDAVQD